MIRKIVFAAALILITVLVLYQMLNGFNDPFVGTYNTNNNYLQLSARNYLRFGRELWFSLPTYYAGGDLSVSPPLYLHHPPLVFWISALWHWAFGFANWVPRMMFLVFHLVSAFVLFLFVRSVWGRFVGIWSAVSYLVFPLTGIFYKLQFFEQLSLLFTLLTLWFMSLYFRRPSRLILVGTAGLGFFNMLTDWYAGYLFFAVPYLWRFGPKGKARPFISAYLSGLLPALLLYLLQVIRSPGGIGEIVNAFSGRAVASELTVLPFWPVRLAVLSLVRLIIYLSPFSIPALVGLLRFGLNTPFKKQFVAIMAIIGLVNPVILPTATWGHSYFLYYLVPLFAVAFGFSSSRLWPKRPLLAFTFLGVLVIWAYLVTGYKDYQQKKQLWKYDLALSVVDYLIPYEPVAVVNFPGDLLENYFFHPTQSLSFDIKVDQAVKSVYRVILVACGVGECAGVPPLIGLAQTASFNVQPFVIGENRGWLLLATGQAEEIIQPEVWLSARTVGKEPLIIGFYRRIRDRIGGIQI
jgi:4-amino-4-deoxy-L-arabinose transferase-like glycosyltransferase